MPLSSEWAADRGASEKGHYVDYDLPQDELTIRHRRSTLGRVRTSAPRLAAFAIARVINRQGLFCSKQPAPTTADVADARTRSSRRGGPRNSIKLQDDYRHQIGDPTVLLVVASRCDCHDGEHPAEPNHRGGPVAGE
jgi:hypothetical protein